MMVSKKFLLSFIFYTLVFSGSSSVAQDVLEATGESPFTQLPLVDVILDGDIPDNDHIVVKSTVKVSMFEGGALKGICSGVIVSKNYVLTSGHCLYKNGLQIKVSFINSQNQESIELPALSYRGYKAEPDNPNADSPWKNNYLYYDKSESKGFHQSVKARRKFLAFPEYRNKVIDIGLIKIDHLPENYYPIEIFAGRITFPKDVVAAGFGTNSRYRDQNDYNTLRFSRQQIIGYVPDRRAKNFPLGLQIYSKEKKSVCFGDSGGPVYIYDNKKNEWFLLGINSFVMNSCANSAFITSISNETILDYLETWKNEMDVVQDL